MENPQDKKGHKTICTCTHTVENMPSTYRPSNSTHTVVKRQTFRSSVVVNVIFSNVVDWTRCVRP